jgi:hypothetical protein
MQEDLPLDAYLGGYHDGKITKKELEGMIFEFILENYRVFRLSDWDEGECIDFLCWFYPRISRSIDHYRYEGASFTAYMITMVRLSAKEYRFHEKEHRIVEKTYWNATAEELAVHSREPDYLKGIDGYTEKPFKSISNPRQALILLLKSYSFVSEEYIARAAPAIGIDREVLSDMVEEVRKARFDQDTEIRNFQERIYGQFCRCRTFERRIDASQAGSARYCTLQKRLIRAKKRLENMKTALKKLKTGASNRQVAEILNVAKGSVDSSLHEVKKRRRQTRKRRVRLSPTD